LKFERRTIAIAITTAANFQGFALMPIWRLAFHTWLFTGRKASTFADLEIGVPGDGRQ